MSLGEEEPEPGICLDGEYYDSDDGIVIKDIHGQTTVLSHEQQKSMRYISSGCGHKKMRISLNPGGRMMSYTCEDCGVLVIEGSYHTLKFL